jgi:hypothetical protein
VSKLRAPALSNVDARRFAYCLLLAVFLHGLGVLTPRARVRRPHPEPVVPLQTVVPVSLDETPARAPAPEPVPPPPPSPTPESPPTPAATAPAAVHEPAAPPTRTPPQPHPRAASAAPPPPRAPQREAKSRPQTGSPFNGRHGAFQAKVCLLSRSARSALAVNDCKPVTEFRTNALDVAPRRFTEGFPGFTRRVDFFGVDYNGRFKVRAAGYYTFRLLADDGALLYIDGELVIDNDGRHSPISKNMSLPLSAGEHEFRVLYYQGPPDELALQLFVKGYKTEERLFGPEL